MSRVDLNADLGEAAGEEPIYTLVSSANVACGGHTGDAESMRRAIRLAQAHGVAIGAHPAYPDREAFGRRSIAISTEALTAAIADQIRELLRLAAEAGASVTHVKPHGALYNDAARDPRIAAAVADGVRLVSDELLVFGLAGSPALASWAAAGLRTAAEGFADRAYRSDGTLVPRSEPGALLLDPQNAATQAVALVRSGRVDTLCVHSDTPGAVTILAAVRRRFADEDIRIASLADHSARN